MFTHLIEEKEEEEEEEEEEKEEEEDCRARCNIRLKSGDVEENSKATRQSLQSRCHITVRPNFYTNKMLRFGSHDQFPSLINGNL